jgi:putative SOS response-associated peptidase YedK
VLLAGLWKFQQLPEGTVTQVFVVLTTRPNSVIAPIHDRMPVVLDESQVDTWMNPATSEVLVRSFLRPAPDDWLVGDKASPLVNSVKHDGPELLAGLLD